MSSHYDNLLHCLFLGFRGELKKAIEAATRHQEDVSALSQHNSDLSTQMQHLLKTTMQSSQGGMHRSQVARIGTYERFEWYCPLWRDRCHVIGFLLSFLPSLPLLFSFSLSLSIALFLFLSLNLYLSPYLSIFQTTSASLSASPSDFPFPSTFTFLRVWWW